MVASCFLEVQLAVRRMRRAEMGDNAHVNASEGHNHVKQLIIAEVSL